jgi:hypothetical protein
MWISGVFMWISNVDKKLSTKLSTGYQQVINIKNRLNIGYESPNPKSYQHFPLSLLLLYINIYI